MGSTLLVASLILYTSAGSGLSAAQENYHSDLNSGIKPEYSIKDYKQIGNKISKTISMQQAQGNEPKDPEEDDENLVKNPTPNSNYFSTPDSNYSYVEKKKEDKKPEESKPDQKPINKLESKTNNINLAQSITSENPIQINYTTPDSVPTQNKRGKIKKYIPRAEADSLDLIFSPEDGAYYTEGVSKRVNKKELRKAKRRAKKNARKQKRNPDFVPESFDGDEVLDQYSPPNYTIPLTGPGSKNYYGSGDMTGNGLYGFDDEALILGSTDDKADIDGDGFPGQANDVSVFHSFMINQIPYLPGHWGFLTSTEKTNWLQKMLAIDLVDQIPSGPGFDCNQYAMHLMMNFAGIKDILNSGLSFTTYDTTNNARFNIPMYQVSTKTSSNVPHKINYVLIGEPGNQFDKAIFIEPQTDQFVTQGSQSLNQFANVDRYCLFWSSVLQQEIYDFFGILEYNPLPTLSWQHPELVVDKPAKWGYKFIGGQGPADITLLYQIEFENSTPLPSISGDVTGNASWSTRFYSDSTSARGTVSDSIFFNFNNYRDFWAKSDSSDIIDTMYMTNDNRFTCDDAQLTEVRDWEFPIYTFVPSASMLFSDWLANGVADSEGSDNCGYYAITRNFVSSTRGTDPNNCDFYEFTETNKDDNEDPTGNLTDTTFTIPIELDPSQWQNLPPNCEILYNESQLPSNTGGWATATNEAGVTINISYVDNSNQNPDPTACDHNNYTIDRTWYAVTDPCEDTIQYNQTITVMENFPSIWTGFPVNPLYVPYPQSIHPDNTGYPSGEDTITGMPATSTWVDSITNQTSTQVDIDRYWTLWDQCMTPTDDSIQVIYQEVMPGTPEQPKKQPIVVYPNPTQNLVHVKFNDIKARPEKIQISNLLGKTLEEIMVDPVEEVEYNASHLPDGMYIMSIGNKKRKFIKN